MRKFALAAVVVTLALAGCDGSRPSAAVHASPSPALPSTPEASAPGTAEPTAAGWIVLFDGSSPAAFRGYGLDSFPTGWALEAGSLHALPGAGFDLISRDTWADFELEFEWRVARGGNSGVIYRVVESDEPSWMTGPEYQVLDDAGHPNGRDPTTSAAALYDLIAPAADRRLEPVGSFNTGRIVVHDGHVEHWLNGERVVAYEWGGADVRALIAASKFRDAAGFMTADVGHVVLQHHGEEAWFRNVRVRPLP